MMSVLAAIQYYEEQGGTASVFINDDGMQTIHPELAEARRQYYRENGIGYTARPPNRKLPNTGRGWFSWLRKSNKSDKSKQPEKGDGSDNNADDGVVDPQTLANKIGFLRKGKFKKASNMNYGLAFSNRVEDELHRLTQLEIAKRGCTENDLTVEDDDQLYQQALENMLAADEGRTCES